MSYIAIEVTHSRNADINAHPVYFLYGVMLINVSFKHTGILYIA